MKAEMGHTTLVFLLTIVILIGFPFILILSTPFFLFRFIVSKLAPYIRPKLGKMVTTRGSILAAQGYIKHPNSTIVSVTVLEGQVDLEMAKESAGKRLIEARFPNGDLKYPELKQYVTTWAGYYFWKDDENFDIKNHITIHQDQDNFTEDDLPQLRQNMLQKPWADKQPMWEIIFVPNCYPMGLRSSGPHTALIIRFHHCIGDGKSWVSLMVQELCQSEINFLEPKYPNRSFCGNIFDQITFPFKASYHLADALSIGFRRNVPFRQKKGMLIVKCNVAVSDTIPLKKMKEIRAHFNVSFFSVVSAVLTGAMRDLLVSKQVKIPRVLHVLSAQSLPGHSLKLRNYFTAVILKYPIGEDNPVRRIKYCDANYKYMKESVQPRLFAYATMLAGSYFSWMIKYVGQNDSVTSGISNFAGPSTVHFNGHKWMDHTFTSGLPQGACGLAFCAASFANGYRVSSTAATDVLSTTELNELSTLILKHVDILYELVITHV